MQKQSTYSGNFVYQNGSLAYILTDEGRLVPDSTGFTYEYFIKDHLGNTRVTVKDSLGFAAIQQETHYYPFGMSINALSYTNPLQKIANKYLYNSKELQDDLGLGWYDYGKRFYDAEVGRWHVPDLLNEIHYNTTPYHYVFNNPIVNLDPLGLDSVDANGMHHIEEITVKATRITKKRNIFHDQNPLIRVLWSDPGAINRGRKISWGRPLSYEQELKHEQWMSGINTMTLSMSAAMTAPFMDILIAGQAGSVAWNTTYSALLRIITKPLTNPVNIGAATADAINQSVWIAGDPNKSYKDFNFTGTITNLLGMRPYGQAVVSNFMPYTIDNGLTFDFSKQARLNAVFGALGNKIGVNYLKSFPNGGGYLYSTMTYTMTNFLGNEQANYQNK